MDDYGKEHLETHLYEGGMYKELFELQQRQQAENGRLRERVAQLVKDVDAAIAGHLDYSYCAECDEMRYFEVMVADGVFAGDTAFRCRVCGQAAGPSDFAAAANNLLQTKADLWQKMANEGGE